jgi:predicted dehydrogenase
MIDAAGLASRLRAAGWSKAGATVVGYGFMGRHYVEALRALGLGRIRVCSRSAARLAPLDGVQGIETVAAAAEQLSCEPAPGELGIISTPTEALVSSAERMSALGFRRLLIEKPVALTSAAIERLADRLERQGVEAWCAYNRIAYPSCLEARVRIAEEGGATSCTYTFTEWIEPDWPQRFPAAELSRWGLVNSLHVMSLAHGLIGWPGQWSAHRSGSLPWHSSGSTFVGSGISERGVAFSYHADWGSSGRWSVEVHARAASYRLCPLERLFARRARGSEWEEIPCEAAFPSAKAGVAEEIAAALSEEIRPAVPLISLRDAVRLARFGESVFGYGADA